MDPRRKSSIKSYGSNNSSRSGSFDFDQDKDRDRLLDDADRREVVVKIDDGPHIPVDLHVPNVSEPSSSYGSGANTPRAMAAPVVLPGSGGGSSPSGSPRAGTDGSRDSESFSFKNRARQSPTSPALSIGRDSNDDPPSRLIGSFLRKQAAAS